MKKKIENSLGTTCVCDSTSYLKPHTYIYIYVCGYVYVAVLDSVECITKFDAL